MRVKVSDAEREVLNWLVAQAEGIAIVALHGNLATFSDPLDDGALNEMPINYSTDWAIGGPIIEREGINLTDGWSAYTENLRNLQQGPTPLIAAMRCFVASRLGDEVDVPSELMRKQA